MTQADAIAILKTGQNVFLTGEPGAGKSHTVNTFVAWLRSHGISVAVTASTGIASTHIGGMTIHSWSGIGIAMFLSKNDLQEIATRDKVVRRVKYTRVLIIDEISMLDGRTLTMVDAVCKTVRKNPAPFGGLQVVLVGDFFQLPPVTQGERATFAFDANAWSEAKLTICYLSEQHRQEDAAFLGVLSALRMNELNDDHIALLNERRTTNAGDMTKLYSHNMDVDRMNTSELAKLMPKSFTHRMRTKGAKPLVEQIMRGCLSPEELVLKVGAKVMFTKNNPEWGVVNGTTGTIDGTQHGSGFPVVLLRSGRKVTAEPMDWSIISDGVPIASVVQVPLRLAWAMTVHKSQGMSLDAAFIDLSSAFAYGQGYVALSRVRTLAGLHLAGLNARALQVDPLVSERDEEFRALSTEAEEQIGAMSAEDIAARHAQNIFSMGGTLEVKSEKEKVKSLEEAFEEHKPKKDAQRLEYTLELILSGKNIAHVADLRSRTPGTIIEHLEKLKTKGKLPMDKIGHICTIDKGKLAAIHAAMKELGFKPMKPVHDRLHGKFSYDALKIAHLFL